MTKHVSNATDTILSVAKAVPLIVGGLGGLFTPPNGSSAAPVKQLMAGDGQGALNGLIANYTFYSPENHAFYANQGNGVKMAVAGAAVHKVMTWLM